MTAAAAAAQVMAGAWRDVSPQKYANDTKLVNQTDFVV